MKIVPEKITNLIKNVCKTSPYSIVSLGPNCYPRTVLTRTGLIKRKSQGQKSYPFDLAWYHSAKYVTEFLLNDFEDFLSDLRYSYVSSSWDSGNKINFSHEAFITDKEKSKLVRMYKRRINNFRKEVKNKKPVLFLQILKDEKVGQDCINTFEALKQLCNGKKFVYVVIDCVNQLKDISLPNLIYHVQMPLEKNTDVFSKSFYESEQGRLFEQKIAKYIQEIIKDEFCTEPVIYS